MHKRLLALQAQLREHRHALLAMRARWRRRFNVRVKNTNARLRRLERRLSSPSKVVNTIHNDARPCDRDSDDHARSRALFARRAIELAFVDTGLSEREASSLFDRVHAHLLEVDMSP